MPEPPPDVALLEAWGALEARQASPSEALAIAVRLVGDDSISDQARVVALWAQGLAERELNRLEDAEAHLRAAIDLGMILGDDVRVAQVSSALAPLIAVRGRPEEALRVAESISDELPDEDRADLEMKRAFILRQLGRPGDALEAYTAALAVVGAANDPVLEARVRVNRAVVLAYQGRTIEALDDTAIAERLAADAGQHFLAAGAAHNHGFTAGLHGDVVTALESFARADALYARVGYPGRSAGVLASDRCEVMLAAGLSREARHNAERAVAELDAVDDVSDLAEARLLLAKACLACGDVDAARRCAADAEAAFAAAGRDGWRIAAEFVDFCALTASPDTDDALVIERAVTMADDLERLGWTSEATSVRVTAADAAISLGEVDLGRSLLAAASTARRHGRADHRADAWLATARLRLVDGDRYGSVRAVLAGLRVLEQHRMAVGATDLRVGAAAHARGLATVGLQMALERGRPADVLVWAERVRAHALEIPAVRPPDDVALASALTELRQRRVAFEEARRSGDADGAMASSLRHQENAVRDLARIVTGVTPRSTPISVAALRRALGPQRRLIEYVDVDGQLAAVVIGGSRHRLHRLGPLRPIADLIDTASFCLDRLARDGLSPASTDAAAASLRDVTAELEDRLVAPLQLGDAAVVLVPTGELHGLPWGALDALAERPVTIAASARRWLSWSGGGELGTSTAVITGPGLDHASREAAAIVEVRPAAEVLVHAPVADALRALDRVAVAHIACHGHFRSDSPMFSSLHLADGPLTVYDIEALASPPALVVLPACNAGISAVSVGDEVIGTAAALLGAGVGAVIAPLTTVNDDATVTVMGRLHRELAAGWPPATALGRTRAALRDAPATVRASAASFVCLG